MSKHEQNRSGITLQSLRSTLDQLDQTKLTLKIIKGIVDLEITEFEDTHIITDANELDPEVRFGAKKKNRFI